MWLRYFAEHPHLRINYHELERQGISRRRSRAIIREMERKGYLHRQRSKRNGTVIRITQEGTKMVPSGSAVKQNGRMPNSRISDIQITHTYYSATYSLVTEEEKEMPYDFFESTSGPDDDRLEARRKHEAKKKADYAKAREEKAEKRKLLYRGNIAQVDWTVQDVAYEFADRMKNYWSIKPFSVIQSRFIPALATFRKQHSTDGAVEVKLMDMFFASMKQDEYTDGNHLWRSFLAKAPGMLDEARRSVVTPERQAEIVAVADDQFSRKMALFDDED